VDRRTDARDAGRVGHGKVIAALDRHRGVDLDLAAFVHLERAVEDDFDRDAFDLANGRDDALAVHGVYARNGHIAELRRAVDPDQVDRAEDGARLPDRARDLAERPGTLRQPHPHRDAVGRRWLHRRIGTGPAAGGGRAHVRFTWMGVGEKRDYRAKRAQISPRAVTWGFLCAWRSRRVKPPREPGRCAPSPTLRIRGS
jgi:hypothetical protein